MRRCIWVILFCALAGKSAAQTSIVATDNATSNLADCSAYLGTLKDEKAVVQIPHFFDSYSAVRQGKLPAPQPVDLAAKVCRQDYLFSDFSMADAPLVRVMASGRTQGNPWIVFLHPAERNTRKGYSAELFLYGKDGKSIRQLTIARDLVDARYRDHMTSQLDSSGLFYCAGTSYVNEDGKETPPWEAGNDPNIRSSLCEILTSDQVFAPRIR